MVILQKEMEEASKVPVTEGLKKATEQKKCPIQLLWMRL